MQRTALESALIPVTAYIVVACVECYRRYPEMVQEIADAVPPEELGARATTLATRSIPCTCGRSRTSRLLGRTVDRRTRTARRRRRKCTNIAPVLDFWERAARAYRFDDGTHQAWDAAGSATPYRDYVDEIATECRPLADDDDAARMSRLNALVTSYLFLLWFDTRSGYQDTGPYRLDDGRMLLLRSFNRLGVSHFPWSRDVSTEIPYSDVLAAFVLDDGVDLRITDFGTSVTDPRTTSPHVVDVRAVRHQRRYRWRRSTTPGSKRWRPRPRRRSGSCTARSPAWSAARRSTPARTCTSRSCARSPKRPGVELDWTVPRDSLDLYPFFSMIDGGAQPIEQDPATYYPPIHDQ